MRFPPAIGSTFQPLPPANNKSATIETVLEASNRAADDNFVVLTASHRESQGRTLSRVFYVRIVEPVDTDGWKVLYGQTFRTIQDAVNGMTKPAQRYDPDFDQPRKWLSGFVDCLENDA